MPDGRCLDHGVPVDAIAVEPTAGSGDQSSEAGPISKQTAHRYRKEVESGRANLGSGAPLEPTEIATRVVALRRRSRVMSAGRRASETKVLEQLEKTLPTHIVDEANRLMSSLTTEIRAVGDSVTAVREELRETRQDMRALARGELPLAPDADCDTELATISIAQAALASRKKALQAAKKEEKQKAAEEKRKTAKDERAARQAAKAASRSAASSSTRAPAGKRPREDKITDNPVEEEAVAPVELDDGQKTLASVPVKETPPAETPSASVPVKETPPDETPPASAPVKETPPDEKPSKKARTKDKTPDTEEREGALATDARSVIAFEALMERGDAAGSVASWAEKYADDARNEAGLSILERMIREDWRMRALGVRYSQAASIKEKTPLTVAMVAARNRMVELDGQLPPGGVDDYMRWKTALMMHAGSIPRQPRRLDAYRK